MKLHHFLAWGALLLGGSPAHSEQSDFWLAAQHDWIQKRGFHLNLENSTSGDGPCRVGNLKLILGVADGKDWHYISAATRFEHGGDYVARAVISPGTIELWIDGEQVRAVEGSLEPFEGSLTANSIPHWADAPTDYLVQQTSFEITGGTGGPVTRSFKDKFPKPSPLYLFGPHLPERIAWKPAPGGTITVRVRFRLEAYPDLKALSPFIDRYGQCAYADWPEKVKNDEELRKDITRENSLLAEMPPSPDFDEYGGYTESGWKEEATGFFRVVRRKDYWWLISPQGNPCFYLGVNTLFGQTWPTTPINEREFLFEWLPPETGPLASAWLRNWHGVHEGVVYVCFHTCNLIRKYGADNWPKAAEERGLRRLKAWGFSGGGKWGAPESIVSCPVLSHGATPKLDRHPDIFDPDVCRTFHRELRKQILPRKDDPNVMGWSLGNEYHEIVTGDEIKNILTMPGETPAKRALLDYAVDALHRGSLEDLTTAWDLDVPDRESLYETSPEPPSQDLGTLRCHYAERYYAFIYQTVKSIDSNHLYFGFWITPGWWESEEDWHMIAQHCDVIGYDLYSFEFTDEKFAPLLENAGKPVFCGEFSYPSTYNGMRGFGRYHVAAVDDADAGEKYDQWVKAATQNPFCVGGLWFHYRNQPLTGRGPGKGPRLVHGEHYAFGLIDVTDRPKWDLVRRMRETNIAAARIRLEAMEERLPRP